MYGGKDLDNILENEFGPDYEKRLNEIQDVDLALETVSSMGILGKGYIY